MVNLTDTEREKFGLYCEQEAATAKGMQDQAKVLGKAGEMLAARLRFEEFAFSFVANKLLSTETMALGEGE